MKAPLSASHSESQNHFFSQTAERIFMKFPIKFWFLLDEKVIQLGKNLILGKKLKISLKVGFFGVGKKFILLMLIFELIFGFLLFIVAFMILQKKHIFWKNLFLRL